MRRLHFLKETKSLQRNYLLGFQLFGDSSWPIPALLKWLFPQTGFPLKATNPAYPSAWWKIEVLGSGGLWPQLFYVLLYKGIRDMKVYRAHFFPMTDILWKWCFVPLTFFASRTRKWDPSGSQIHPPRGKIDPGERRVGVLLPKCKSLCSTQH